MVEKWLYMFRIRCEHQAQGELFVKDRKPSDVILDSFMDHPAAEIGGGSEWHIAAAERFASGALAFQIGRVQSVKNPQYDDKRRRFYEADVERAPYAHGVFDGETQVCVIEKKSTVTYKAPELAIKLQKLLNNPGLASKAGFRIVVGELRDPEGFIEQIRRAERVTRFQFIAEFENPHDVFKLIHGPAERYNELIRGETTTVETRGADLDKDVVEEMARSAASVGDPASATIKEKGESKGKTVYLRGAPLIEKIILHESLDGMSEKMLEVLRAAYRRLRQQKYD